jgi:NADH:ubiquinone oxidoreductase subunit E
MKESDIKTKLEVYVCNFGKECSKHGSDELADKLKKWAKEEHKGEIKVIRSGCLGQCDEAIAIACYPDKKFLLNVEKDDFKEIKKGLEEALEKLKD